MVSNQFRKHASGRNLTSVRSNGADCIGPTGTHVNALIVAEDPMVARCTPVAKRVEVSIIIVEPNRLKVYILSLTDIDSSLGTLFDILWRSSWSSIDNASGEDGGGGHDDSGELHFESLGWR